MPAKKRIHFQMIRAESCFAEHFSPAGFAFTVWTLTRRLPKGILSFDSCKASAISKSGYRFCVRSRSNYKRAHDLTAKPLTLWRIMRWSMPGLESCVLGQIMSGVVAAMRRTLLSCTSLARNGLMALALASSVASEPAFAGDLPLSQAISAWLNLNHQEAAVLTTALALVGFSVLAAILLMRTRVRATRTEVRLRSDIAELQVQAHRLRALLFAETQVLISWAAGDNRPQISGDTSLLISQDAQQNSPQRILAFGTWLPPEPALQMDHAVDALREAGEGFLLNLSTSNGRAIEALGRAIGGQTIGRIREPCG